MKIAIGCDHAGPELKAEILAHLDEKGVEYTDFGIQAGEKVDYPDTVSYTHLTLPTT